MLLGLVTVALLTPPPLLCLWIQLLILSPLSELQYSFNIY